MTASRKETEHTDLSPEAESPSKRSFKWTMLPIAASMLSGALLALAFPGFGHSTLIFAAMVPLMYAVHSASVKKASWLGLLSGFVFFMMSLAWLRNLTGTVEGFGLKASALLGYALLALYCALYFIPFAIAVAIGAKQWAGDNLWKNVRLMFALTMVWVGSEYLRGVLFTGFLWNPLGVALYANPTIIQIAEWGGVSMVSATIVWMNAGLFITFRQYTHGTRGRKYRPHIELMLGILPLALSVGYGMNILFNRPGPDESVRLALVQPNIRQLEKWDAEQDRGIRETLSDLTDAASRMPDLDLIIWPETALPDFVRTSPSSYDMVKLLTAGGVPLLAGTMDVVFSETGRIYYNSSILFGTNGTEIAKYDKQHLVPFGEYVPFAGLLRKFTPLDVDFSHGEGSTLLSVPGRAPFSVLICFEDTVAPLSVIAVRAGARWLVNQTNDAWFDPSSQSEQHLAHAVFRCIENRIPMARCCNTGVTCVIDAYGSVQRNLDVRTQGFTIGELQPRPEGLKTTFYTRHGSAFGKVSVIAGATVLFVLRIQNRKHKTSTDGAA